MAERTGYAVVGLGLFGSAIARTLAAMGHDVLAIDRRLARVEAIGSAVHEAVQADATDRAALTAMNIGRMPVVFVTIGDLSASILCTLALRELGVGRIITRIDSPQQGRVLQRVGATDLLFPERDMGERVARQIASSSPIISEIELSHDASILEIPAPAALVDRTIEGAAIRSAWNVTVVAVKQQRGNGSAGGVVVSPAANLMIRAGDRLVVAGRNEDIERLRAGER